MPAKRNGKIELFRFVFCIIIILYHIGGDFWSGKEFFNGTLSFFGNGRTGVEFFFLVSGFLAAKSAYKLSQNRQQSIGKCTYDFMFRKIKSVFIPHIIVCILAVVYLALYSEKLFYDIFKRLPSLLFLERTGIGEKPFVAVEWYLASMFFALVIIYPLLLKSYDFTAKVIAPAGSAFLIGYLIHNYGMLPNKWCESAFTYSSNLRAVAVILLGVFCFEMSQKIKAETTLQKILLCIAENGCLLFSLFYTTSGISQKYEGIIVYMLAVFVTLAFSTKNESRFYGNRLFAYLGKISLPVYLCQDFTRNLINKLLTDMGNKEKMIIIVISTIVLGIIIDVLCGCIDKLLKKKKVAVDKQTQI